MIRGRHAPVQGAGCVVRNCFLFYAWNEGQKSASPQSRSKLTGILQIGGQKEVPRHEQTKWSPIARALYGKVKQPPPPRRRRAVTRERQARLKFAG